MTAHELARLLLTLPDLPVMKRNDVLEYEIMGAEHRASAQWFTYHGPDGPVDRVGYDDEPERQAIVLLDNWLDA